jgi:hypothetical protein
VRVEERSAFCDEVEQAAHQLRRDVDRPDRFFGFERCAGAVAAELVFERITECLASRSATVSPSVARAT